MRTKTIATRNKINALLFIICPMLYLYVSYGFGKYSPLHKDLLTGYLLEEALYE
jgi:hypothetical protein